jgi:hypothetical protein
MSQSEKRDSNSNKAYRNQSEVVSGISNYSNFWEIGMDLDPYIPGR